jgi:hypothetical protein
VVATAVVATTSAIDAKLFANNQTALSNRGGFFYLKYCLIVYLFTFQHVFNYVK